MSRMRASDPRVSNLEEGLFSDVFEDAGVTHFGIFDIVEQSVHDGLNLSNKRAGSRSIRYGSWRCRRDCGYEGRERRLGS